MGKLKLLKPTLVLTNGPSSSSPVPSHCLAWYMHSIAGCGSFPLPPLINPRKERTRNGNNNGEGKKVFSALLLLLLFLENVGKWADGGSQEFFFFFLSLCPSRHLTPLYFFTLTPLSLFPPPKAFFWKTGEGKKWGPKKEEERETNRKRRRKRLLDHPFKMAPQTEGE